MKAMLMTGVRSVRPGAEPLEARDLPVPEPGRGEIRIRVEACGVCHTELDEIEGRTAPPNLPIVPGHEIVGVVDALGDKSDRHRLGDRVGVGWFYDSCGECEYCESGRPNLCRAFRATGRDANGGYAEYTVVPERAAHAIPETFEPTQAAPLLCAGAVGFRALSLCGIQDGQALGFYGFGASAHLVIQMARHRYPDSRLSVFTRSEDKERFARELGADWAGPPGATPPEAPHAIIDTTPVWSPLLHGLAVLAPGGRFVINAIRKTDSDKDALLELEYATHLWMEKEVKSVANVTPEDIRGALDLAAEIPIRPNVSPRPLHEANDALVRLKEGSDRGATVLTFDSPGGR